LVETKTASLEHSLREQWAPLKKNARWLGRDTFDCKFVTR
jgi:hypothetical protein